MGGNMRCFSIEDEASTFEASSRRVGRRQAPRGEQGIDVPASLTTDPTKYLG